MKTVKKIEVRFTEGASFSIAPQQGISEGGFERERRD